MESKLKTNGDVEVKENEKKLTTTKEGVSVTPDKENPSLYMGEEEQEIHFFYKCDCGEDLTEQIHERQDKICPKCGTEYKIMFGNEIKYKIAPSPSCIKLYCLNCNKELAIINEGVNIANLKLRCDCGAEFEYKEEKNSEIKGR